MSLLLACNAPITDTAAPIDADGDGYDARTDCDDDDPDISPAAPEACDGLDNNCNGVVDETATVLVYEDGDGDGYGDPEDPGSEGCLTAGLADNNTDCDDTDAATSPGSDELCDGIDNDCDGTIDINAADGVLAYQDDDGDGYGDGSWSTRQCTLLEGYVEQGGDCRDDLFLVHSGAAEACDGRDTDCDDSTGEEGLITFSDGLTNTDMTAAFTSGTAANPAAITLDESGSLQLCGGSWYASLDVAADVDITGREGSEANVLSGGGSSYLLHIETSGLSSSLSGLTLTEGAAFYAIYLAETIGGAISCGAYQTSLSLEDVTITDSTAVRGGGLSIDGCDVVGQDVTISGNLSERTAGGVYINAGSLTLTDSTITNNTAIYGGGGLVDGYENITPITVSLTNTLISNNMGLSSGGGLSLYDNVQFSCTGATDRTAGILGNSAPGGSGGVYMHTSGSKELLFTATDCDFGTGKSDNVEGDIMLQRSSSSGVLIDSNTYTYGDDASFSCDAISCQ